MVIGDPDLIGQLLINLLENVATHTPAGTDATLSLTCGQDMAVITVRDDGPGLASGDFARVTQPFQRGRAAADDDGSGLGLAIANAIARFHHGSLDLEDAAPGLRVSVSIPLTGGMSVPRKAILSLMGLARKSVAEKEREAV
jgi:signal transduction histidine kinase